MRSKRVNHFVAMVLSMGLIISFSGCHQESKEAVSQISSQSQAGSRSDNRLTLDRSENDQTDEQKRQEEGGVQEEKDRSSEKTISVLSFDGRIPVKAEYHRMCEDSLNGQYTVEDGELLKALTEALNHIEIKEVSDIRVSDDTHRITLIYQDGKSDTIMFEGRGLLLEGKRYELSGYQEVQDILDKIAERESADSSQEDSDSDEWIKRMAVVEKKISSVTGSEEFSNGDLETRRKLAMDALTELEEQGYVRKGTIYYDGYDSISFIYECCEEGVLGGVMLREFAPDQNGINNSLDGNQNNMETPEKAVLSGSYRDFVDSIAKMPASEEDYQLSDFYNYLKRNNNRWNLTLALNDKSKDVQSFMLLDRQQLNGVQYYSITAGSQEEVLISRVIYQSGNDYYIAEPDGTTCLKAKKADCSSIIDAFDLEKYFGNNDEQCGICIFDNKQAIYRQFVSDKMVTVLFFDESGLLGGNIYTVKGYYDENSHIPASGDYSQLLLSGTIYGNLTVPTDASLAKIPPLKTFEPDCGTREN